MAAARCRRRSPYPQTCGLRVRGHEVGARTEVEFTRGSTKSAPHTVPYDRGADPTPDGERHAGFAGG